MKKNISINISGIIFHIEEDAFDELKDYLDSINRYFSSFADSQEIIADIESRIAEIFLSKLNDEKQVITLEDVNNLKSTMGSISDFQAAEEEFDSYDDNDSQQKEKTFDNTSKKLYRDDKRKLIAGVCAGVAHYFNIDPLWIRLLFVILLIGSGGIVLPIYIVMWAVVPKNADLPEDKKLKKMFRDTEGKVVAGVSAGLASYFGVDVVIIRILFVISLLLGGVGLLTYVCLWIVLPEAKSASEKVQMKGDPVTLSNIETNIKQSLNVKEDEEENILVKLLLFPFRLVATLIEAFGKAIGPFIKLFIDLVRIIIGASLVFAGAAALLGILISLGVLIGVFSTDMADMSLFNLGEPGIPFDTMTNGLPAWTIAAAVLACAIPLFFMILFGSSIIAQRIVFSANTGWTLLAGFIISIIILAVNVPMIVFNFNEEGDYTVKQEYDLSENIAILKLRYPRNRGYNFTNLRIRGYSGENYLLEQVFEAQGSSRRDAEDNARMLDYRVELEDSTLYFDANTTFKSNAIFRGQHLDMVLYIPYGAQFMMDEDLKHILRNTIYNNGYHVADMEDNLWTFSKKGLECLTCRNHRRNRRENNDESEVLRGDNGQSIRSGSSRLDSPVAYDKQIRLSPFDAIEIEGAFTVNIEHGEDYQLFINGNNRYIDDLDVMQSAHRLSISHTIDDLPNWSLSRDDIELTIVTPEIKELEITGACSTYMTDFRLDDLKVDLTGASTLKANISVDDLEVELTGASKMEIRGKGNELRADLVGASHLEAYGFEVKYAQLEAQGVSNISAFVTKEITMEESFISNIKYRGGARVIGKNDDW